MDELKVLRERRRKYHYYKRRVAAALKREGSGSRAYAEMVQMQNMYSGATGEEIDALFTQINALQTENKQLGTALGGWQNVAELYRQFCAQIIKVTQHAHISGLSTYEGKELERLGNQIEAAKLTPLADVDSDTKEG